MECLAEVDTTNLAELTELNMSRKISTDLMDLQKKNYKLKLLDADIESIEFFVLENRVYSGAVLPHRNLNHVGSCYEMKLDEHKKHPLYYYIHFKESEELDHSINFDLVQDIDL